MSATTLQPQDKLQYGKSFAGALQKRLEDHFASLGKPEHLRPAPLAVGLFGGWGSGKTLHLEHLRRNFLAQKYASTQPITLPILFNAWRHESEPHLIVPLLKTTNVALNAWLKERENELTECDRGWLECWLEKKERLEKLPPIDRLNLVASQLKDAALALASGLEGTLDVPVLGKVDLKAILKETASRSEAHRKRLPFLRWLGRNQPSDSSSLSKLDAIYHDFETHLRALTGVDGKGLRLNLLFLIDDLDRCLPEKAVQMLESIKLFLDVPGCAFVLALDDEVVERGIAHRYRDYEHDEPAWDSVAHALNPENFKQFRAERDHQRVGPANPVSGHEYLEKLVHLPLYVPVPNQAEVHSYLIERFPDLFAKQKNEVRKKITHKQNTSQRTSDTEKENTSREKLLELIARAIPANPRKLNRLAELYAFKIEVAQRNGWKIETVNEQLTLMRLCAVQLLAPDLYRFGRSQYVFFEKLENWLKKEGGKASLEGHLENINRLARNNHIASKNIDNLEKLERLDEPLLAHLRNAQSQRSGFDPLKLLNPAEPCDRALMDYYRLARPPQTTVTETAEIASLSDSRTFISQLLSSDPLAWRNALAQEADALAGKILDQTTFTMLLERLKDKPEHVTVAWIETLALHLSRQQMFELYRTGDLLRRLNAETTTTKRPVSTKRRGTAARQKNTPAQKKTAAQK